MRKIILVLGLALSASAFATGSSVQSQLDDLKAGLHQVHMNTLGKYSESWGLEDRANIKDLKETKVDKTVFAADQKRQDQALASAVSAQAQRDAGQDEHINAVQNSAQAANDSAVRLSGAIQETNAQVAVTDTRSINNAVRLDGVEQKNVEQDQHINAVQEVASAADSRSQHNAVRLDGVEQVNDRQDTAIASKVDSGVFAADQQRQDKLIAAETSKRIDGDAYVNSRVDAANAHIEANRQASAATNKRVAEHTAQLANHEQRITGLEQQTNKAFSDMKGRIDRVEKRANAGASAALSAAAIPQVTEYQTFALGAGVGGYEGESALAVGFSSRVSSAVVIKAAVTTDSQHGFGYNAGVSVGW